MLSGNRMEIDQYLHSRDNQEIPQIPNCSKYQTGENRLLLGTCISLLCLEPQGWKQTRPVKACSLKEMIECSGSLKPQQRPSSLWLREPALLKHRDSAVIGTVFWCPYVTCIDFSCPSQKIFLPFTKASSISRHQPKENQK